MKLRFLSSVLLRMNIMSKGMASFLINYNDIASLNVILLESKFANSMGEENFSSIPSEDVFII